MSFQAITNKSLLTQIDYFKCGIEHTPEEKIDWKPDENSMSALDMIQHLAISNVFFASMISGSEPPPAEGTPKLSLEEAIATFEKSCEHISSTILSVADDDLDQLIDLPNGQQAKKKYMMTVPGSHIAYHWGQLSYLQKQFGDEKDHFLEDPNFHMGARYNS